MSETQQRMFPEISDPRQSAGDRERESQRELMAKKRASGREVEIYPVEDEERRNSCRLDLALFCRTYFPLLFYLRFSPNHLQIINHLQETIIQGGRVAIAAPRGYGKSTLTLVAIIWGIVYGHVEYVVFIAKNKGEASERLKIVKTLIEEAGSALAEDFPEVCLPAVALEGAPQRGRRQTVDGKLTRIEWGTNEVVMPTVKGSQASGSIISAHGLDEPIRGLLRNRDGNLIRPDLVIGDDPQTDESARSLLQTTHRILYLTKAISPLAAPGHTLAIILLVTVIERGDLADQYTSEKQPSYRSIRLKSIDEYQDGNPLYQKYIELRHECQRAGDYEGRAAHAWYLRHRSEIEDGVSWNWDEDYIQDPVSSEAMKCVQKTDDVAWVRKEISAKRLPRNALRQKECSPWQHELNFISDADGPTVDGWSAWKCERQNDPPETEEGAVVRLDAHQVMAKTLDIPRRRCPNETITVVKGMDIGRHQIHWVEAAVLPGRRIFVADYGIEMVDSPNGKVEHDERGQLTSDGKRMQQAIRSAILSSLRWIRDTHDKEPVRALDGREIPSELALIDCRYNKPAIREFCAESGGYRPIMGMGTGKGQRNWTIPRGVPSNDISSDGNLYARIEHGLTTYHAHADAYKRDVHAGLLLPWSVPGGLALFDPDEGRKTHAKLANHLTAEVETQLARGVMIWQKVPGREANHYFDSVYYALAAVSVIEHWHHDARLDADLSEQVDPETGEITVNPEPKQKPKKKKRSRRVRKARSIDL